MYRTAHSAPYTQCNAKLSHRNVPIRGRNRDGVFGPSSTDFENTIPKPYQKKTILVWIPKFFGRVPSIGQSRKFPKSQKYHHKEITHKFIQNIGYRLNFSKSFDIFRVPTFGRAGIGTTYMLYVKWNPTWGGKLSQIEYLFQAISSIYSAAEWKFSSWYRTRFPWTGCISRHLLDCECVGARVCV